MEFENKALLMNNISNQGKLKTVEQERDSVLILDHCLSIYFAMPKIWLTSIPHCPYHTMLWETLSIPKTDFADIKNLFSE